MTQNPRFDLSGQVILLTGGAGQYGSGLLAALAETGARVVAASRNVESLQAVAAGCPGDVSVETLDQSDEASVLALRERIRERFGRLDGLVNNAVARPMRSLSDSAQSWDESMAANARGMLLMHRHFGDLMASQPEGGSIVNIGSIYGMTGPTLALYAEPEKALIPDYYFHKAGLINLTRFFAAVYGKRNVRVNCVSAGGLYSGQAPDFVAKYNEHTFLGRMADREELAGPVIFLLTRAASYVTGENLVVDGGFTAH